MKAIVGWTLGLIGAALLGCVPTPVVDAHPADATIVSTDGNAPADAASRERLVERDAGDARDASSVDRRDGATAADVPAATDGADAGDAWPISDAAFDRFVPKDTGVVEDAATDGAATEDAGAGRLFSFAIVTDIHVGRGPDDYGTPGYDDSGGGDDVQAANLALAVARINASIESYDIALVMVLGDNSDSGEKSEMTVAKTLLDQLAVPYFPLIGNHDIWPYTATAEAPSPLGDRYFETIFGPQFESLASAFSTLVRAPTPVFNPDTGLVSSFINYGFDYRGYHFVALDLVTREHGLLGYPGVLTAADLHDFSGGTWPWFTDHLAQLTGLGDHNVLVFCHHPPIVDSLGIDGLTIAEYNRIDDFIRDHGYGDNIYGFFSGHHHLDYTWDRFQGQRVVVTADTGGDASVRVVQIFGNGSVDIDTFLH